MKRALSVLGVLLLAGCSLIDPSRGGTRVHIRAAGRVVTTYELARDGRILRSSTKDRSGTEVSREYSYDDRNELVSVSRENLATREVTLFLTREVPPGPDGRLAGTTKTLVGPQGATTEMDIRYFYGEDGRLDGMMQTDANGNVQAKSAGD